MPVLVAMEFASGTGFSGKKENIDGERERAAFIKGAKEGLCGRVGVKLESEVLREFLAIPRRLLWGTILLVLQLFFYLSTNRTRIFTSFSFFTQTKNHYVK
ncbi:hypothetical protein NC651_008248 [Populus alba x Populus x berolinensis]|nr:hypothetical protein NC651_008248 [Populus alba x Populus x berolinensis]